MQFFVQLLFTDKSAGAVADVLKGLESFPWATPQARFNPHITLGAGEVEDESALASSLHPVLKEQPAFALQLTALGTFGVEGGILFLSPAYSRELHALFEKVNARLGSSAEALNPLYTPGLWTPHCTLFMGLDTSRLTRSMAALTATRLPLAVHAQSIELCKYPTLEVLQSWTLLS